MYQVRMSRMTGAAQRGRGGHASTSARAPRWANLTPYHSDPVCQICSSPSSTIRHVHVSTEYDRRAAVSAGKRSFYCISCGREHGTDKPTRRHLLITSSTLYRFDRAPGWSNPSGHFDVEAIVGATVNDGHEVFQHMYGWQQEPVDAVIVLGINNVLKNHSTGRVVSDINNLKNAIYKHSVLHHHKELGLKGILW